MRCTGTGWNPGGGGRTEWTPLACGSLAFAVGPPVVTQALVEAVQVLLQAQGHLLVTSTQLPFTPAPSVSCGQMKQERLSICPFQRLAMGCRRGPETSVVPCSSLEIDSLTGRCTCPPLLCVLTQLPILTSVHCTVEHRSGTHPGGRKLSQVGRWEGR